MEAVARVLSVDPGTAFVVDRALEGARVDTGSEAVSALMAVYRARNPRPWTLSSEMNVTVTALVLEMMSPGTLFPQNTPRFSPLSSMASESYSQDVESSMFMLSNFNCTS